MQLFPGSLRFIPFKIQQHKHHTNRIESTFSWNYSISIILSMKVRTNKNFLLEWKDTGIK